MIVIDASAVLETLLVTSRGLRTIQRIFAPDETLHAPHLLDLEVLHVLCRYLLEHELTDERAEQAVDDYFDLPIARYCHELLGRRIWEMRHNFTAYDAAYVALAELLDAPLMTADSKLARAAKRYVRVERIG